MPLGGHTHLCAVAKYLFQCKVPSSQSLHKNKSSPTRSRTGSHACDGELHLRETIKKSRQWSRLHLCSLKKENSCKPAQAYHKRSIFFPLTAFVLKKNNALQYLKSRQINKHPSHLGFWGGWFFFLCRLLAALRFSQSMKIKIIFFIKKGDNFRLDKALFLSIDKQSSSILQMGTCLTAHLCDHWISGPSRTEITNESSPASMISKLIRR